MGKHFKSSHLQREVFTLNNLILFTDCTTGESELDKLKLKYGNLPASLDSLFRVCTSKGLYDLEHFEKICQMCPTDDGPAVSDFIRRVITPLKEMLIAGYVTDWSEFDRLQACGLSLIAVQQKLSVYPRALQECRDYSVLFEFITQKIHASIPYFRQDLYDLIVKDMPVGMLAFIFIVNKIGISLKRVFDHRADWNDLYFWLRNVGICVVNSDAGIKYEPTSHTRFHEDIYRFINWAEHDAEQARIDGMNVRCDEPVSLFVTITGKKLMKKFGRRASVVSVKQLDRAIAFVFPDCSFVLPNTVFPVYQELVYQAADRNFPVILNGTCMDTDTIFKITFFGKSPNYLNNVNRKVDMLQNTLQYFQFEEYSIDGQRIVLDDSRFISLMTTIWQECRRIGSTDYVAGYVSFIFRQAGIDAKELLADCKASAPDLIHTVLFYIASRVASGDESYIKLLKSCHHSVYYSRLITWVEPNLTLFASLFKWFSNTGIIKFSLPEDSTLNELSSEFYINGKAFDIIGLLINPTSFLTSIGEFVTPFSCYVEEHKLYLSLGVHKANH